MTPRSLALTLRLSIRLPSVYSSCSPSLSPFLLLSFSPFTLTPSLSLFLPVRELHEQVPRSSPYRVPLPPLPRPSPFLSRTMFHHSLFVISSRGLELSGFFNLLIILLRFLSNRPRDRYHAVVIAASKRLSSLSGYLLLEGGRRSTPIHWTQPRAHFNPPIPIVSFFPRQLNPSAIISADRYSDSS